MRALRGLPAFLYDFLLGEDPALAVAVVGGLGGTAALQAAGVTAWWLLPATVLAALAVSLRRASR
ncbi:MAG: hypothetical protein ABSG64_01405 [Solirubrobacteraceae bacterium]|jgi:hypothetical protein